MAAKVEQNRVSVNRGKKASNQQADVAASGAEDKVASAGPKVPPMTDVFAGGLARAASQSTIHPMDTVKVRMQAITQKVAGRDAKGVTGKGLKPPAPSKLTPAQTAKKMREAMVAMRREVISLYKGVGGAASGAGLAIGAYFLCYSLATRFLERTTDLPVGAKAFTAGAAGAVGASIVKVPASVLIRGVQAGVYTSVFQGFGKILASRGVPGLFVGYLPTLIEDVPDMAVKFAAYESLRQMHAGLTGKRREDGHAGDDMAIGGIAGAAAAAATTPLDAVKTRMMVGATGKPLGPLAAAAIAVRTSGVGGLFAGWWPRTASNFVNSGIFFVFFEALRATFSRPLRIRFPWNHRPAPALPPNPSDLGMLPETEHPGLKRHAFG